MKKISLGVSSSKNKSRTKSCFEYKINNCSSIVNLLLWKKKNSNHSSFFFLSICRQKYVLVILWRVIWSVYQELMLLHSNTGTIRWQKANSLSDFHRYTIRKKFSSWTWSSEQAWNEILFNGEFQTFHGGNRREKWPLSSQKSLAANCWHLYFWWCSEIPDIWGWANRVN